MSKGTRRDMKPFEVVVTPPAAAPKPLTGPWATPDMFRVPVLK